MRELYIYFAVITGEYLLELQIQHPYRDYVFPFLEDSELVANL